MKSIKVTIRPVHRTEMEDIASKTGLSFNQMVNSVWANSDKKKKELVELFAKKST